MPGPVPALDRPWIMLRPVGSEELAVSAQANQGTFTAAGPGWRTVAVSVPASGDSDAAERMRALEDLLIETVQPWTAEGSADGDVFEDWYATRQWGDEPPLVVHLRGAEDKQIADLCEQLEAWPPGVPSQGTASLTAAEGPHPLDAIHYGAPAPRAVVHAPG